MGLTKTVAREWGAFNIRCNAIAYGFIATRLTASKDDGASISVNGEKVRLSMHLPNGAHVWQTSYFVAILMLAPQEFHDMHQSSPIALHDTQLCCAIIALQVKLGIPGGEAMAAAAAEMLIPLKRIGTPDEAAGAMLLLASPYASFISGQVSTVCEHFHHFQREDSITLMLYQSNALQDGQAWQSAPLPGKSCTALPTIGVV